jgi:3-isopropylmalate/(R)-2-methylmalate dehydratase large subunit
MAGGKTLSQKIWDSHVIATTDDGQCLLHVDRHFLHEGSAQAFERLDLENETVHAPEKTFGSADHYVPTKGGMNGFNDPDVRSMVEKLAVNTARFGIRNLNLGHPDRGIIHVIGPELGLTLPGLLILCSDSHTSTHGALGAFAFGIGASEAAHVLATQTLWQAPPKAMRVRVEGVLPEGISAKDLILHIISKIGTDGATGHVVEYAGPGVEALSMEGRLTLCNMSIEAGARAGLIAPDQTTFDYIAGRAYAPKGELWNKALTFWQTLKSDRDAVFDKEVVIQASDVEPTVTWGTSPEDGIAVSGRIPDPSDDAREDRRTRRANALKYMGLKAGMPITDIEIDQVFIGSCANARIEDLAAAARILKDRRVRVPTMIVPGSEKVKQTAEELGLDRIFVAAGAEWRDSGCSMCVAINGTDVLREGVRCASTSNRNFVGRQGRGSRTHLMSPAMAAAAAVAGRIVDVRALGAAG